jgi:hypothetical protein
MKFFTTIATGFALLVSLSAPAQAARFTSEPTTSEQAATAGDTRIAGLLLSEYDYE